jgi:hypothetical protein
MEWINHMLQESIDLFFEDPSCHRQPPGEFGILHLLRRDIDRCLQPGEGSWLGVMGILAGIDLLGKFLDGDDRSAPGDVGRRFKNFLKRYFHLGGEAEATAIYQLRNSLLHSFGLYSRERNGTIRRFCLVAGTGDSRPLIKTVPPEYYLVDVPVLKHKFETAIHEYREDLRSTSILQTNFMNMFTNYGKTSIFGAV